MTIALDQVLPDPIARIDESEVWGGALTFEKGSSYLVYSPSGAGKSTLLNILYGKRFDYSGKVTIDGHAAGSLSHGDWSELRASRLSIIKQGLDLFPRLDAFENVFINPRVSIDRSTCERWFDRMGIAEIAHKPTSTFSFGQKQRVAIARGLAQPCDMLLLDEPFSHLDQENAQICWSLIREVAPEAGVIMTSLSSDWPEMTHKLRLA